MSAHTPGPWRLDDCGLFKSSRRVVKGAGKKSRTVCIIEDWTTEPDARLIAAAPAMLEAHEASLCAFERIAQFLRDHGYKPTEPALVECADGIKASKALVAKARGGK